MKTKVTVTPADQKEQDIFAPGNLVCWSKLIVMVSTLVTQSDSLFAGTVIDSPCWLLGTHLPECDKKNFTQFHGTVTLTTK